MVSSLALVLITCVALLSLGVEGWHSDDDDDHDKRSDDNDAVQAVLATHAQKLAMLEAELQSTKAELQSTNTKLQSAEAELHSTNAKLQSTNHDLQSEITVTRASQGSSFVRWGRSTCPSGNDTRILYSGFAAGARYTSPGGGANRLCVIKEPVFDGTPVETATNDALNGMEYWVPGHHHTDALCAVCHTARSATYMVPGTNRCPAGSVTQYRGFLTAGDHRHPSSSEFLCLDGTPEDRPGTQGDQSSGYFMPVTTHCGALPCPPYAESKVVLCVVCSV